MDEFQTVLLKKLKTYKNPKTAAQLHHSLQARAPFANLSVQKVNSALTALCNQNKVTKSNTIPREYRAI